MIRRILGIIPFFYQSIAMALSQIASNFVRSILTTVGIVIGVAAVIAVVSALTGLQKRVLNEFEGIGTDRLFAAPSVPDSMRNRIVSRRQIAFDPDLFDDMLRYTPSVRAWTRVTENTEVIRFGQTNVSDVTVIAIDPGWHQINRRYVTLGRPFSLVDVEQGRPVALVNTILQSKLGLDKDPLGQQIIINQKRYTIVGIIEERKDTFFGFNAEGAEAIIPITTLIRSNPDTFFFLNAAAISTDAAPDAASEIEFYLRARRGISPTEEPDFIVRYLASLVNNFVALASGITAIATGVVAISLAVGGVGIMNIMLVSVSERTREIGLRKAVGAHPAAILFQFLIEAVVLCTVGGLVGIAIGYGIVLLLAAIPALQLTDAFVPLWAILLSFGFSAAVGVIFGMFPAIKAARLDPIDALRHE